MARETTSADQDEPPSGMSVKGLIVSLVLSIAIGGGSGFGMGYFFGAPQAGDKNSNAAEAAEPMPTEAEKSPKEGEKQKEGRENKGEEAKDGERSDPATNQHAITLLDPIVTNLSDPDEVWIRLELAMTSEQPIEPDIASQVHQDLLAYVRAMRLSEMTGPSAFIDLKAELLARARLRSENRIQNIYVKTLLYE